MRSRCTWHRSEARIEGATKSGSRQDELRMLDTCSTPYKGHVATRYDGWYANRPRGMRRLAPRPVADAPPVT